MLFEIHLILIHDLFYNHFPPIYISGKDYTNNFLFINEQEIDKFEVLQN